MSLHDRILKGSVGGTRTSEKLGSRKLSTRKKEGKHSAGEETSAKCLVPRKGNKLRKRGRADAVRCEENAENWSREDRKENGEEKSCENRKQKEASGQ